MPIDAKQQFADVYKREHATTLKVLKAYPQDKADYRPHPGNNTAKQIVWTFVVENNVMLAATKGPVQLGGGFPAAPATIAECIAAYEKSAKDSIHHRGQLSVYIRPAGGKVPSIYGPSGDEPWR